jgi:undecaprenyl-diphosphatase
MNILDAFILGVVEGLTEFLPISSTAHLIIMSHFLHLEQTESVKTFEIFIQLGAILSIFSLFAKEFFTLEKIKILIWGFLPTAFLGLLLYKPIKHYVFGNLYIISASLIIGGLLILFAEKKYKNTKKVRRDKVGYTGAFIFGLSQALAFLPGVSRSGAIVVVGLFQGYSRETVLKFAFLLAVPTMASASLYDLLKSYTHLSFKDIPVLAVGFTTSFIVSYLTVAKVLSFIKSHTFLVFGYYRIVLGILLSLYLYFRF